MVELAVVPTTPSIPITNPYPPPPPPPPTSLFPSQLNAVQRDELMDDEEYNDILEDMYRECSKYGGAHGRLNKVVIPRPSKDPSQPDPSGVGKVMVEYSTAAAAAVAVQALHGRSFGDNTVHATFMEEHAYLVGNYG